MSRFTRVFPLLAALMLSGVLLLHAAKIPRPLADITIDMQGGQRARLVDGKGKIRVIAVISTECDHCVKTVATLSKINTTYKSKGVEILGAAANEDAARLLPPFLAKNKPSFRIGLLSEANARRLGEFDKDEHPFAPIMFFVDRNNTVQYQIYGNDPMFQAAELGIRGILDLMLKQK